MQGISAMHSVTLQGGEKLQCSQRPTQEDAGETASQRAGTHCFSSLFPKHSATTASGISFVLSITNHQGWLKNRRVCLSYMYILSFCIRDLRSRPETNDTGRLYLLKVTDPQALRFPTSLFFFYPHYYEMSSDDSSFS